MGGPTFPQSSRFASATVAWREPTSSARRSLISSREPLFLIPFVTDSQGKQLSDEKQHFCIWTHFSSVLFILMQKRPGRNDCQHQISGPDPFFLNPFAMQQNRKGWNGDPLRISCLDPLSLTPFALDEGARPFLAPLHKEILKVCQYGKRTRGYNHFFPQHRDPILMQVAQELASL